MKAGDTITPKNIRRLRPGYGISPKYIDKILNKKLRKSVERGDRVTWDCIQ